MGPDGANGTDVRETLLSFLDALYGYGLTLTRNATETEDLVQDTYMQAALHCENLRRDSNIKAWMFTIMRNRWLKQFAARSLRAEVRLRWTTPRQSAGCSTPNWNPDASASGSGSAKKFGPR